METYELILRDALGATLLIYAVNCASEHQARAIVVHFQHVAYAHFELWCEDRLVVEGPRLAIAA